MDMIAENEKEGSEKRTEDDGSRMAGVDKGSKDVEERVV